jgi:hypothetical protein
VSKRNGVSTTSKGCYKGNLCNDAVVMCLECGVHTWKLYKNLYPLISVSGLWYYITLMYNETIGGT